MPSLVRVSDVEFLSVRTLRVFFTDGLVRELDFTGVLSGLLEQLDDDEAFSAVGVDVVSGTLCWPGGIDLDPDVLHGDEPSASPIEPRLVREYRVERAT